MDEAEMAAWADQAELEGEVLLSFVTDTAAELAQRLDPGALPVRRVLDIGSGPGVGTCELALRFPEAQVVAVDFSPAMLERTARRAAAAGLAGRVSTHLAELPGGLDDVEPAQVIWASMSLHHVGDETAALRVLRHLLSPGGLLAIAEVAEPLRVLPDDLDVGRPGLADRLDRAAAEWFNGMRAGLPDSVPSADLPTMLTAAGLEVVVARLARRRFGPPLDGEARRLALGHLGRQRVQLADRLDDEDLKALDVLSDADDRRSIVNRPDGLVASSRQITIARPA